MIDHEVQMKIAANVQRLIIQEQENVKSGKKPWGVYSSSHQKYSKRFSSVLTQDSKSFEDLFKARMETHNAVHALELCGSGAVFNGIDLTTGTAVTLNDFRSEEQKVQDQHLEVIEGSLLDDNVWSQLANNQDGLEKVYDFILFDPDGGWKGLLPLGWLGVMYADDSDRFIYGYIQKCWELLDPDGGELFLRPVHLLRKTKRTLDQLMGNLRRNLGIGVTSSSLYLPIRIKRELYNPSELPTIEDLIS